MLDKAKIGKELKKDGTLLIKHIDGLPDQDRIDLMSYFEKNDSKVLLKKYILFSIKSETIVKYITLCIRNVHTVLHFFFLFYFFCKCSYSLFSLKNLL